MPSNDERGVSSMELEVQVLTDLLTLLNPIREFERIGAGEQTLRLVSAVNSLTARLINRGHPAGYVVNESGTFMVSVEKVSNATLMAYTQQETT